MFDQDQKKGAAPKSHSVGGKVVDVLGKTRGPAVGAAGVVAEFGGLSGDVWHVVAAVVNFIVRAVVALVVVKVVAEGVVKTVAFDPSLVYALASRCGVSFSTLISTCEAAGEFSGVLLHRFDASWFRWGLPYSCLAVVYARRVKRSGGVLNTDRLASVKSHVWWFSAVMVTFTGVLAKRHDVFSSFVSVLLSVWFGNALVQHSVWALVRKYGATGVDIAVVANVLGVGVFPALHLPVLLLVSSDKVQGNKVPVGTFVRKRSSCSVAVSALATEMNMDLSRIEKVISMNVLHNVGTGAPGQHENELVRMQALTGDRAMSLALVNRAWRCGWSVGAESNVSQRVVTNAALARYYHARLKKHFPSLAVRSEKRIGTLVEALVGAAFNSGCTLAEIEVFVFTQVLPAQEVDVTAAGDIVDRIDMPVKFNDVNFA